MATAIQEITFATTDDLGCLLKASRNQSTVQEYFDAVTTRGSENAATRGIDNGLEPYLISSEAIEMGIHPYLAVHDILTDTQDGQIGLDTSRTTYFVAPETLLAWR